MIPMFILKGKKWKQCVFSNPPVLQKVVRCHLYYISNVGLQILNILVFGYPAENSIE